MIVVPAASVVFEFVLSRGDGNLYFAIGKWFVFWGIGVRLLLAGISQVVRPGFTAKGIFNIADPAAETIVTELGHANVAFGLIGLLSLLFPAPFLAPAAVSGGVFLALDGLLHLRRGERSRNETIALVTDFFVSISALVYLVGVYATRF